MKWKRLLAALCALAVVAAAAIFFYLRYCCSAPAAAPATAIVPQPAEISLAGTIQARNLVALPATSRGRIEQFFVEIGDQVYEGQVLAHIKNNTLENTHEQAKEELDRFEQRFQQAESALIEGRLEVSRAAADATRARGELARLEKIYQRQQTMYRGGAASRNAFEKAQAEYNTAKTESENLDALAREVEARIAAQTKDLETARRILDDKKRELEEAQADLESADVKSPVTGQVVARRGEPGSEVSQETTNLFEIATDLSVLDAVVEPDPKQAGWIQPGMPALVQFIELGSEAFEGVVREIKDNKVYVEFASPNPAIQPGDTVQVRIRTGAGSPPP